MDGDSTEQPPPALLSIDEIYTEYGFTTIDHAPYIDEETAEYSRTINELREEVDALEGEIDDLEGEVRALKDEAKVASNSVSDSDKPTVARSEGQAKDKDAAPVKQATGQTFNATYYSAYCPTCGEWGGITATGDDISSSIYVRGKRVVAVDPNVIPLGSTVKVSTPSETFEALALDTGGDIKGNRIDILVESTEKAYSIGRHDVKVEVLN